MVGGLRERELYRISRLPFGRLSLRFSRIVSASLNYPDGQFISRGKKKKTKLVLANDARAAHVVAWA
jgi:hypothetical protein